MMGVQAAAPRLFYDFCLDDHVPADHQLRGVDRHLDLDDVIATGWGPGSDVGAQRRP
jgi:hypothetical protein